MTTIKCWTCGYIVEAEDNVCPECGAVLENLEVKKEKKGD
jgi:rubrerythrin